MFKFDPVDVLFSAGSSLFGRMVAFFSAGMVGFALGWVALCFREWKDFLNPFGAIEVMLDGASSGEVLMWLVLWPFASLGTLARPWFFLLLVLVLGLVFVIMVYSEEPVSLWYLLMVTVTSLVPLMLDFEPWPGTVLLTLAGIWTGLGMIAFYRWRVDYRGGRQRLGNELSEGKNREGEGEGDGN